MAAKEMYDTHHIVPVSIGGASNEENTIRVPRDQHALYHQLFNNYHPSTIIRLFFHIILPLCFNITINTEERPYCLFIEKLDQIMFTRWSRNNISIQKVEQFEKIEMIYNFQKYHSQEKRKEKINKFKTSLYQFCTYHHSCEWTPTGLFKQLCFWFKIHDPLVLEIETQLNYLYKNKGH